MKRHSNLFVRLLPVVLVWCSISQGGENRWTSIGPFGGTIRSFAFHSQNDKAVFALSQEGDLFRSRNTGLSWERLDIPTGWVWVFRVHPATGTLYAAGNSMLRSMDMGAVWEEISRGGPAVVDFEFHPTDSKILYAVTNSMEVYKSVDEGRVWVKKLSGTVIWDSDANLEVGSGGDVLYVSMKDRLFKSTNSGEGWLGVNRPKLDSVITLAVNPKDSQTVYAGGTGGIYKTTDGGTRWSLMKSDYTWNITVDPKVPQNVYAVYGNEKQLAWKSSDGGTTWKDLSASEDVTVIGVHPRKNNYVFAGMRNEGIFRSENGGSGWKVVNTGLGALDAGNLQADSQHAGRVFAAASGSTFRSTNSGSKWELVKGLKEYEIIDVGIHPINGNLIVAHSQERIFISTDGGTSWEAAGTVIDTSFDISVISLHPEDQNIVLAGGSGGLAKSTDRGKTWKQISSTLAGEQVSAIAVDPRNGSNLFAATYESAGPNDSGKLFISVNGGSTWKNSGSGLKGWPVRTIAVDPTDSKLAYAGTSDGLYKSINSGKKWVRKSSLIPRSVVVDPLNSNRLLAAFSIGLYVSTDSGERWSPFDPNGLDDSGVWDALINPWQPDSYFIGTDHGVFSYSRKASANAPVIEQLLPGWGKVGETITLKGRDFGSMQGTGSILFGNVDAGSAQSWSDTGIQIRVPSEARTGFVTVTVASRKSNTHEFLVLPATGSIEPASGPSSGGTRIAVLAPSGIPTGPFTVFFGSKLAGDVRQVAQNIIVCTAPPGTGTVTVFITTKAFVSNAGAFTYQ